MCSDTGMSQKQTLLDILQKKCTWKFRNIHRTIPAPESIFDKAWYDPQPATKDVCNFIQKKWLWYRVFRWILQNFDKTFFTEHL